MLNLCRLPLLGILHKRRSPDASSRKAGGTSCALRFNGGEEVNERCICQTNQMLLIPEDIADVKPKTVVWKHLR